MKIIQRPSVRRLWGGAGGGGGAGGWAAQTCVTGQSRHYPGWQPKEQLSLGFSFDNALRTHDTTSPSTADARHPLFYYCGRTTLPLPPLQTHSTPSPSTADTRHSLSHHCRCTTLPLPPLRISDASSPTTAGSSGQG